MDQYRYKFEANKLYTTISLSKKFKVSQRTIQRYIKMGKLKREPGTRKILIKGSSVNDFLNK